MNLNLDEYQNPSQYDCEYGSFNADLNFYLELAKEQKGPVLDIACGTGRVTIPLAEQGFDVTGLDLSGPMLKKAYEKSKDLDVSWIQGNCFDFQLGKQFSLILMAGNAFQALLTRKDQDNFLNCVKQHLLPDGILALDTRNLNLQELENPSDTYEHWHDFKDANGEIVQVFGKHTYDLQSQIATYHTLRKWSDYSKETVIKLKYTLKDQLIELLEENGFKIKSLYGTFNKEPWTEKSQKLIILAQFTFP